MNVTPPDSANPNPIPAGDDQNQNNNDAPKVVPYETHRKLLDEKKQRDAELKTLRDAEEARKRQALEEQGNYKALLEEKDKELEAIRNENTSFKTRERETKKLRAILESVEGSIDPKFHHLIDRDGVIIDEATGEVDKTSAMLAAKKLKAEYPEFIKSTKPGMPNAAPQGDSGKAKTISIEDWKKLPSSEMKKWNRTQIIT